MNEHRGNQARPGLLAGADSSGRRCEDERPKSAGEPSPRRNREIIFASGRRISRS